MLRLDGLLQTIRQDLRSGNVDLLLTRYSDILLAMFITSIVAMMLIPLPTQLLDLLLTLNISAAMVILFVSIYIQDATQIASFPTILLITTLFRLGLNVSSTRLILLQADAGEVIRSFGSFVAGGNIVVGIVIFLILTIIQFVVITKGAERVAEVAARFTLDALPGRQMSIDADFRAGLFDVHEARRRRNSLQRESQLYGAMDGAMKFVKGDAIAGIIITLINLIGGFAIGVLQMGMTAGRAGQTYSILSIGDGLVSQIPALLISVAAGIVVTRVASEEGESHLGKDIGRQILAQPKAISIVGVLLVLFGLVPGLPTIPFLVLGLAAGGVAYGLYKAKAKTERTATAAKEEEDLAGEPQLGPAVPILVQVGPEVTQHIAREGDGGQTLARLIPELRNSLYYEMGVLVPHIQIRGQQPVGDHGFAILLKEVPVYRGTLPPDRLLVDETASNLVLLNLDATEATNPATHRPAAWIPVGKREQALAAGLRVFTPSELLMLHLVGFSKKYLHEFLGLQEVRTMLDQLAESHPSLVEEVVPKVVNLFTLTEVLQRLVRESVSIRDLKGILQALAEWGRMESDPLELTELVRSSLARQISFRLARPDGKLVVYTVDPEIQHAVKESVRRTNTGHYLGLSPDIQADILEAIRRELGGRPATAQAPVVLVEPEIRPYFRRLVELEFPDAAVLSMRELTAELIPQPIGMISIAGARAY